MKKLIVLVLLAPIQGVAWVSGGAANFVELSEIDKLARDTKFRAACPINEIRQTSAIRRLIGRNVLFYETSCNPKLTVQWDENEGFPSLGLPHVVWFPPDYPVEKRVGEAFPAFWEYLKAKYDNPKISHGSLRFPKLVNVRKFPWVNKYDFDMDMMSDPSRARDLNDFLNNPTVLIWQTDYIIQRGLDSAYRVLAAERLAADKENPDRSKQVCQQLQSLMKTGVGLMSIVDYANFKGEGVDWRDVRGRRKIRWGLKQVLERMASVPILADFKKASSDPNQRKFASSAMASLTNLAHAGDDPNSAAIRKSYLTKKGGWYKRILTVYAKGGVAPNLCRMKPFYEEITTRNDVEVGSNE